MKTPDEQRKNLEGMRSGEEKGSVHKLPGEDLPSLETMYMPHGASQLSEHLLVELLATIGHEFRTPLSVIQGTTSMLLRQRQQLPAEEQLEFLHMIQTAGERLEFLTERLLELAQLQVGAIQLEYRVVDVSSVVREAIAHVEQEVPASLRDRVSFYLHCRDEVGNQTQEVPSVRGDVRRLREVLDQLLENAVRFSPNGGRIDVIARPAPQGGPASDLDQSLERPSFLEICVCDLGVGIPDASLQRIFERFYRVDTSLTREVNSLGLGLTICEYLVALHQGRIWAESCTAGGSAFHLWLPLAEPRTLN
jgi:signal transduction histidine kinase